MRGWLWSVSPEHYPVFVRTGTFAIRKVGRQTLQEIQPGDVLFAYLSGSRVIAGMFEAVGTAFYDTTPLVAGGNYPHRLRVRPVVALSEEAWVPYEAFHDKLDVVRDYPTFGAVAQRVIHPLPKVDEKVLEFLVRARQASDLEKVLDAYDAYLRARADREHAVREETAPYAARPAAAPERFSWPDAIEALLRYIEARGFVYQPWEIAAYVAALRTKPFVILAGTTGTGKSRLPALVEDGTGGHVTLVPVRPDWADSSDVLGYTDLQGHFRPGAVLQAARRAMEQPDRHHTCVIDEMNLARVEQYLAEILSRIEARVPAPGGGYRTSPLLDQPLQAADDAWRTVTLEPNFALAGTVNVDESVHGFSRKVLDRAFTLELADVDLSAVAPPGVEAAPAAWPVSAWHPRAVTLAGLGDADEAVQMHVRRAVDALTAANRLLMPAQAHVAYRTRDEVILFLVHAADIAPAFRTRSGEPVDPLDLALHMKVLPRLLGGSQALRRAVLGLLGWATAGTPFSDEPDARPVLDAWDRAGRPGHLPDAVFPRTAARLCLMWERLLTEGYTSFWV